MPPPLDACTRVEPSDWLNRYGGGRRQIRGVGSTTTDSQIIQQVNVRHVPAWLASLEGFFVFLKTIQLFMEWVKVKDQ
jgi:hypothetical protein